MAKHVSSAEYRYIPIENVIMLAEKDKRIKELEKQVRKLVKENIKLRNKEVWLMYEEWKSIEYSPKYEVSNLGRFRKKNPKNGYRYLKPFKKHNYYVIKIDGKAKSCARLVAHYHIRPLTKKDVVYHKNRLEFDNFYRNLKVLNKREVGIRTGYLSKSKRVVEIESAEIIRSWKSARKASKDLFVSIQTICDYCNGKVKNPMYKLMWEDDYWIIMELLETDILESKGE